jgi:exosortase A
MKLDTDIFADAGAPHLTLARKPLLAAGLAVLFIVLLYWRTAASMVAIWWRSETFAHGFVVVPICLWLVWRRREALSQVEMKPWSPGLAGILAAGGLWLAASAADALSAKQFAFVLMIEATIVTVIGLRATRVLMFPLAFLFFAVPAGEILVPRLIEWTADFTVAALRASGIPVYREANHFVIPSGTWSVVETCSGLRYLIASLMVGTLYASLAYQTATRRAAFVAASILVPIVANWFRAYMIVMLAHLSNNKIAVGVDHLIYGWIFFGLVMLLLFWVGSFWQESADRFGGDPSAQRPAVPAVSGRQRPSPVPAAIVAAVLAGLWWPIEAAITSPVKGEISALPVVAGATGWVASDPAPSNWKPHYGGFDSERAQAFRKDVHEVGLYLAYYHGQEKGHELITSGNALVAVEDSKWRLLGHDADLVDWAGQEHSIEHSVISGSESRLHVFRLYWIAGHLTQSPYMAKILTAWSVLRRQGDDSALIVVYTPQVATAEEARRILRGFVADMSPQIDRALAAARGGPG